MYTCNCWCSNWRALTDDWSQQKWFAPSLALLTGEYLSLPPGKWWVTSFKLSLPPSITESQYLYLLFKIITHFVRASKRKKEKHKTVHNYNNVRSKLIAKNQKYIYACKGTTNKLNGNVLFNHQWMNISYCISTQGNF